MGKGDGQGEGAGKGQGEGQGQGQGEGQGQGSEWRHGLFGCFGNLGNCKYEFLCIRCNGLTFDLHS